jgi:hypothetical protein
MNVRAHPMNYARRHQYRRLSRAGEAAAGGTSVALLGLAAASVGEAYLASVLLLAAVALGVYSRRWISLARRSAVGARSEDAVQRALAPLEQDGWRLRHSLRWRGQGDIDSVGDRAHWDRHRDRDQDRVVRASPSRSSAGAGGVAVAAPAKMGTKRCPCRHVPRSCAGRRAGRARGPGGVHRPVDARPLRRGGSGARRTLSRMRE